MIKGVILAGGQGTRLGSSTRVTNKHLFPVYDKPLIYYPLLAMKDAGIKEVLLTSNKEALPSFRKLLGNGSDLDLGLKITYAAQEGPKGIAHALGLAEKFAQGAKIAVMLGDNIFMNHKQIKRGVAKFVKDKGARLFLKEVTDPERFGVAHVKRSKIISIAEKPRRPRSNLAVTGLYLYDPDVFAVVKTLKPSKRGELEITDVNNHYVKKGLAKYEIVDGEWIDAGTFDSLVRASILIKRKREEAKGVRKLSAYCFKLGSKLFQGSGFSRLPFIRAIKEKLSGYLIRNIPPFVVIDKHIVYLDDQDRLELSIRGSYEPNETEIFKKLIRAGDIVLDVGAHIGYHTLTMARLVGNTGKVVAFEPDPVNFALLEKNIATNKYSNVTAIKKGVSELTSNNGRGFHFPLNNSAGSLIEDTNKPKGLSIKIDTVALDDFINNHLGGRVDLIKLDIDGGEHFALQGMHATLKKDSLVLLMEYNPAEVRRLGYGPEQDFALLQSNGFKIYSLHDHKNQVIPIADIKQAAGRDLLCIKGERWELLEQ